MGPDEKTGGSDAERAVARVGGEDYPDDLNRLLSSHGVSVRIRCRQCYRFNAQDETSIYHLNSGLAFLGAGNTGSGPRLLSVLYPRDMFSSRLAPPLENVGIYATIDCQLTRLRAATTGRSQDETLKLEAALGRRLAAMYARANLHVDRVNHFPADARLISFLVEIALRTGRKTNDSMTCELPLSRRDIGSYLAINPDTVSRIFTTFRSKGYVKTIGNRRLFIENVNRLFDEFPACQITAQLIASESRQTS